MLTLILGRHKDPCCSRPGVVVAHSSVIKVEMVGSADVTLLLKLVDRLLLISVVYRVAVADKHSITASG